MFLLTEVYRTHVTPDTSMARGMKVFMLSTLSLHHLFFLYTTITLRYNIWDDQINSLTPIMKSTIYLEIYHLPLSSTLLVLRNILTMETWHIWTLPRTIPNAHLDMHVSLGPELIWNHNNQGPALTLSLANTSYTP